jgi:hypothetical protein
LATQTVVDLFKFQNEHKDDFFEAVTDIVTGYQAVVGKLGILIDNSFQPLIESHDQFKSEFLPFHWL